MKTIHLKMSVLEMVTLYPELKEILYDLGFTDLIKPGMLQSVGRFMTLEKGSKLKGIPLQSLRDRLEAYGFELTID